MEFSGWPIFGKGHPENIKGEQAWDKGGPRGQEEASGKLQSLDLGSVNESYKEAESGSF